MAPSGRYLLAGGGFLLAVLLVFGVDVMIKLKQTKRNFGNCLIITRKERKLCVRERKTLGFLVCLQLVH